MGIQGFRMRLGVHTGGLGFGLYQGLLFWLFKGGFQSQFRHYLVVYKAFMVLTDFDTSEIATNSELCVHNNVVLRRCTQEPRLLQDAEDLAAVFRRSSFSMRSSKPWLAALGPLWFNIWTGPIADRSFL